MPVLWRPWNCEGVGCRRLLTGCHATMTAPHHVAAGSARRGAGGGIVHTLKARRRRVEGHFQRLAHAGLVQVRTMGRIRGAGPVPRAGTAQAGAAHPVPWCRPGKAPRRDGAAACGRHGPPFGHHCVRERLATPSNPPPPCRRGFSHRPNNSHCPQPGFLPAQPSRPPAWQDTARHLTCCIWPERFYRTERCRLRLVPQAHGAGPTFGRRGEMG